VVYGFRDLPEQLESLLRSEGEEVITELADRFVRVADKRTTLYEPRRGDFCALFPGRLKDVRRAVNRTAKDIDSHAGKLGVKVVIGVVELPLEALTPGAALDLADERRNEGAHNLRPHAPQSLSARVSNAVGNPPKPTDYTNPPKTPPLADS
jgi:hypothetical protein